MLNNELMINGNYDVASIKDATVRRATMGMAKAIAAGVKSGWQFAYNAAVVKEAFTPVKGQEIATSLKEQFGTIKGYCEATGVGAASIHNSAKAFKFMIDNHLVPKMMTKDGKEKIDFDRFTLNVAQAVELAAYSNEQLAELKKKCEADKIQIATLSSSTIRRFKSTGSFVSEGSHKSIESGSQGAPKAEAPKAKAPKTEAPKTEAPKAEAPKAEAPKAEEAPKVITATKKELKPAEVTKAQVIDAIFNMMKHYNVSMTELATEYNKRIK